MNIAALKKSLLTALKYAGYTAAGALVTWVLEDYIPNMKGNYVIFAPVIGGFLKTLVSYLASKAAETAALMAAKTIDYSAYEKAFMTAFKYAAYTGLGALCTFVLEHFVPSISGNFAILTPVIGGVLKTIFTYFATKAQEVKVLA